MSQNNYQSTISTLKALTLKQEAKIVDLLSNDLNYNISEKIDKINLECSSLKG